MTLPFGGISRSRGNRIPAAIAQSDDFFGIPARHAYFPIANGRVLMSETSIMRRLAAILAADVVGYSRMMGEDEAGTLAALRAIWSGLFNPAVASHRGRIVKMMGDGALVEFGSAVDAVWRQANRLSHRHQPRRYRHRRNGHFW
jgi:class 3 adenylate cyclase